MLPSRRTTNMVRLRNLHQKRINEKSSNENPPADVDQFIARIKNWEHVCLSKIFFKNFVFSKNNLSYTFEMTALIILNPQMIIVVFSDIYLL